MKAIVAKIELGEGDAGIVYVTDAEDLDQGLARSTVPRRRQRPGDVRRGRRQGLDARRCGRGVPGVVRRAGRPGDPGRLGFLAAVVIEARAGVAGRGRPVGPSTAGRGASARRASPPLRAVPRAAGRRPRRAGDRRRFARRRPRLTGRPRRALAEPGDDRGQPRHHGRARHCRWRSCSPGAGSAARASLEAVVDLPIVLPPSVAGLALLLVFGRRGLLGDPLEVLGISRSRSRRSRWSSPRRSSRRRSSSARRGPGSPASTATSRTQRGSTAPPSGSCSGAITVPLAERRPGGRARDELGAVARRVRGDDHVRRQRGGPDADPAAGRLRRVPGRRTSTRRSRPPRSWCWRRSGCSSRSASSTGAGSWTRARSPDERLPSGDSRPLFRHLHDKFWHVRAA